ncbi:hypothetical protein [Enterococcus sp. DIV0800]|uniref:hypothetical protein n=1 Tax=unclassified Enterococcus TaxID=2608891 RepID=UPI003D2FEC90
MGDAKKLKVEQDRKQFSLQNMYFNRYLIIRYLTALFFFINLYWLICLLLVNSFGALIPMILLVGFVPVVAEQYHLYRKHQNVALFTKKYFLIQGMTNLCLAIVIFTPFFSNVFPFLKDNQSGRGIILLFIVSGILLCVFVQWRLKQISNNQDKHFYRIQKYEKALH